MLRNVNALPLCPLSLGPTHILQGSFHVPHIKRTQREKWGVKQRKKMHMKQQNPQTNKQPSVPMAAWCSNLTAGFPWLCLLPHRPPFCLTDGSCDCNHPSYCQRQKKRVRKGEIAHTISFLLLSRVQQTSHPTVSGANTWTTGPPHSAFVCVYVFMCVCAHGCMNHRENMRGCASLAVCACPLYCMISHWSVHRGAVDMSDLAADQKHQRLVPLWPCKWASYQHVSVQ